VVLLGKQGSSRSRSFRFKALRDFEEVSRAELSIFQQAAFPLTLLKSSLGFALNDAELEARAKALEE
jgi:hypothetical protein